MILMILLVVIIYLFQRRDLLDAKHKCIKHKSNCDVCSISEK